jgi:hypothetical protein
VLARTYKSTDGILSHCKTVLDVAIVYHGVYHPVGESEVTCIDAFKSSRDGFPGFVEYQGWSRTPRGGLILRKLLIPRNSKLEKNHKNAEVRYTSGTRNGKKDLLERPPLPTK